MFSVTTMPSSTTSPVASTIASRVSTLIEYPSRYMTKNVPMSETGMSMSGRNAMAQSRKNRKMMRMTSRSAMSSVSSTSLSDCRTNRVLSNTSSNTYSGGVCFLMSARRR